MVHREILIPDKENHSVEMPEQFYGRKVVVIIMDVAADSSVNKFPVPPVGKVVSMSDLFEYFGAAPDSPPTPQNDIKTPLRRCKPVFFRLQFPFQRLWWLW